MGQVYITEIAAVLELPKVISFNFVCFVSKSSCGQYDRVAFSLIDTVSYKYLSFGRFDFKCGKWLPWPSPWVVFPIPFSSLWWAMPSSKIPERIWKRRNKFNINSSLSKTKSATTLKVRDQGCYLKFKVSYLTYALAREQRLTLSACVVCMHALTRRQRKGIFSKLAKTWNLMS